VSRKRQLKKEQQRALALDQQLEDLCRRGADDAFLELVHARGLAGMPALERYGEIADRALRQALAAGDLERIGRLLKWLRRDAALRPLAKLAAVVDHLAEGRLESARSGLAAPLPGIPQKLLSSLTSLCSPGLPRGIDSPLNSFSRELALLAEHGFQAGVREIGVLQRHLGSLRTAQPADSADQRARKILAAADEHLRLLAALDEIEAGLGLRRAGGGSPGAGAEMPPGSPGSPGPLFIERMRGLWKPLQEVFRDPLPAALLRPLRQALRLRWRGLLQLVAERDETVWAWLSAASPALFALDLEETEPGGSPEWLKVRQLLAREEYRPLALFLESKSRSEKRPDRLAVLWALELWAWKLEVRDEAEEDDDEPDLPGWEAAEAALARLRRMAAEVAQRIPGEQRAGVARFLRVELAHLLDVLPFSRDALDAAGTLLQHLPDDPALLAMAVVSAVALGDGRARDLFAARVAARGARGVDQTAVLAVVAGLDSQEAVHIARGVSLLRPLFTEDGWREAVDRATRGIVEDVMDCLVGGWTRDRLRRLRADVASCRGLLPEAAGLEALEAALDCLRPEAHAKVVLRQFLARCPDLDRALVVLRVLDVAAGPWGTPAVRAAASEASAAVVSRLDLRWRLWRPFLPMLAVGPNAKEVRRLKTRVRQLLRSKDLRPEDRTALQEVLTEIAELEQMKRDFERTVLQNTRRRSRQEDDQFGFDF
jgi:hypothetical protein